ncbi:ABC transporter ATP-binding protein [Rhabdothermincola sp.]|uniref:ABC transporter ATP-binding protein n=1 Tax=Rhabdothermincola sp. TaxID=2820405 RepID=UPI002FE27EAE
MTATTEVPAEAGGRVFRRGMGVVLRHARRQRRTFAVSLIGATVYAMAAVGTTVVLGRVTNQVIVPAFGEGVSRSAVVGAAVALLLIAFLRAGSIVLRRYFAALTTFRTQAHLRREVTDRYLQVPLGYHRATPTGQLLAHADSDVLAATEVLNALPFSLGVMVLIVFALISLLLVDPLITLVAVLLFPLLALLNRVYTTAVERPVAVVQRRVAEVSRIAHESFDGALVVKTLGRSDDEVARLDEAADRLLDARVRVGRIRALFEPAIDAIPNIGIILLLLIGSWELSQGMLNEGELVQAMALFGLLAFPMRVVGFFLQELPRCVVATARLDRVLAEPGAPEAERSASRCLPAGPLGVRYDDVSFAYGGHRVLEGVSLRVDPGEIVALVGATGAGKTTLCELLVRMADPLSGTVSVGGVDLRWVEPTELRRAVALVFQETFLFADTVAQNITLGDEVSEGQLIEAARVAQAHEFISRLPDGYETVVGERGVTLSGGQRQRVALARALLRRPRVLVLDDATSAVDPVVEAEILEGLRRALDMTTLVVAHRVSTIGLADRVVLLESGRVIATGTHEELLSVPAYEAIVRAYETGGEP